MLSEDFSRGRFGVNSKICCGFSLEAPHQGASNDHAQHIFYREIEKLIPNIPR